MANNRTDLEELIKEQIGFLERSCVSFDDGYTDEAKRMAVTVRVLLHDTANSHSLFQQLGYKNYMLINTCPALKDPPPGRIFQAGLAIPSLKGYIPRCEIPAKTEFPVWLGFRFWWNNAVIKTVDRTYSRRELVLLLANKEGGAHVNPSITAHYEILKSQGSGVVSFKEGEDPIPMTKEEHVCLRQITHELLESLKAIQSGEAPIDDQDDRLTAFRFPVHLFIKAEGDTPLDKIKVATIESLNNLLPVFDNEQDAEKSKRILVGDYDVKPLGKIGFVKILKSVILPRGIEYLTINPDLVSEDERIIKRFSVIQIISDLESEYTDDEIEQMIKDGQAKRF
jgi:hypothetical protein